MVREWYEWRHNLLDPIPPYNIRMSPNIILSTPSSLAFHPNKSLLPLNHCGFGKKGHPIYWERTGYIQSTFPEVKKKFSNIELLQFHLQSNEYFENRLNFINKQLDPNAEVITKYIVVFDMNHLQISLDMDSIWYIKQMLEMDQKFYPERLYKLFIINCPWYFNTIYSIFKPFIDQKTRDKIIILGGDFLSALEEVIDRKCIPTDYGGEKQMTWTVTNDENEGTGVEQIEDFLQDR
jgi:hypothetical protein